MSGSTSTLGAHGPRAVLWVGCWKGAVRQRSSETDAVVATELVTSTWMLSAVPSDPASLHTRMSTDAPRALAVMLTLPVARSSSCRNPAGPTGLGGGAGVLLHCRIQRVHAALRPAAASPVLYSCAAAPSPHAGSIA